ncbi:MAG: hypothetical protein A3F72_16205 [Bacteroidetes bacterium RIFCSPLOWO2_12_FULL_35_15]|nr:MAG: hypothetical protein A3F72_16205 [Bacteroidetes bacterium RIFCSPLOWO2_12_FULL_35_15]
MKKTLLLLLVYFTFSFLSLAQKITSEVNNSNILENEDGYLIYGVTKEGKENNFHVLKYDKKLNEIENFMQLIEAKGASCQTYFYGYKFSFAYNLLGTKGAVLKLDKNLKFLSFDEYGKNEISILKEDYAKQDQNKYYPNSIIDNMHGEYDLEIGENMLKLFRKNRVSTGFGISNINNNAYKEPTKLIGYKRNDNELFQSYSHKWEIDLSKFDNVRTYNFYSNNDWVYLYISNWGDNSGEYLLSINYKEGKILFVTKLELDNTDLKLALSDLYFDQSNGSILLAGNYYDNEKIKTLPKREQLEQMHGYYFLSLNKAGKIIHKSNFEFSQLTIANIDEDEMQRKFMRFQKITKNQKGNYELLGENMRIYTKTGTAQSQSATGGITTSASSSVCYQTYGFTFLEINPELKPVSTKYETLKWVKNNKLSDFDKKTPANSGFQGMVYEQDLLGALLKRKEAGYYKFSYQTSNDKNTGVLYNSGNNYISLNYANGIFSHKLITDISIIEDQPLARFFNRDEISYYRFIPSKKSFVFEKVNY